MRILKQPLLVYTLLLAVILILLLWWGQGDMYPDSTHELRDLVVETKTFTIISKAEKNTLPLQQQHRPGVGSTAIQFGPYEGKYFEDLCGTTKEWLVECSSVPSRPLTPSEAAGGDILFSVKTTLKYHDTRPREILDTWLQDVDPHNVFFVTDARDNNLENNLTAGMHMVVAPGGNTHNIQDLCVKTGVEMQLLLMPENSKLNWICHIDDDIYLNVKALVKALSHFNPKTEAVYFGRSRYVYVRNWPKWFKDKFPYAQGGLYCFNRIMLEKAKDYIVGPEILKATCKKAYKPDDITMGLIVGVILKEKMNCTSMIFTHYPGFLPDNRNAPYFKDQIAFPYGFGTSAWSEESKVTTIPGKLFQEAEDSSQFRSLHCFLNPDVEWCVQRRKKLES